MSNTMMRQRRPESFDDPQFVRTQDDFENHHRSVESGCAAVASELAHRVSMAETDPTTTHAERRTDALCNSASYDLPEPGITISSITDSPVAAGASHGNRIETSIREHCDDGPLSDTNRAAETAAYRRAIENFIGTVKVPVGIAGPLKVRGLFADGEYYLPLATTEAALVASYSRGAEVISAAGGCTTAVLAESISRAPGLVFDNLREAAAFADWAAAHVAEIRCVAESTSAHGKLVDLRTTVEGNHVYLHLDFTTGDAAGQNMVTIAADAVCGYIRDAAPSRPRRIFVESNASGDKKACARSLASVRGKRVAAEVLLSADLVKRHLGVSPEDLVEFWCFGALGSVLSGTVGAQAHFANGLAALYIACGQDAACVAESAVGVTRFELAADRALYASVMLPNIVVGTVGGGTELPSQRACLDVLGLSGPGSARALAEICAGLCLAGELSLSAAICAGNFTRAHRVLGRVRARRETPLRSARFAGQPRAIRMEEGN